jgi:hypothetical protein
MSSIPETIRPTGRAEKAFREAFNRLKKGQPERLSKNSRISQNNIAKEAGCDPSALRKTRFLTLIAEIQRWNIENPQSSPASPRQAMLAQRRHNLSLKDKIEILTAERDHALSLLLEADTRILELIIEISELKTKLPTSRVTHLRKRP